MKDRKAMMVWLTKRLIISSTCKQEKLFQCYNLIYKQNNSIYGMCGAATGSGGAMSRIGCG